MHVSDIISEFAVMLANMDRWLEAGTTFAGQRGFEADVLAQARLFPDQYTLTQQVQSACDQAKFAAAYLSGKKAPSHPDTEKTIAELRARIQTCRDYLATFSRADFDGGEERPVSPAWMQGNSVRGDRYLHRIGIPNFYFHVAMAYAILRHNGVPLGKQDYVGLQSFTDTSTW
ncbi:MAG TPA: DUF1993 domain-containing protein [Candidatus Dormibacteraeota bacterium]|nr:DUF1993 domain-containing protein [Candidatus Dormibacteraeota bacterium]